jgi:hypothetical protein
MQIICKFRSGLTKLYLLLLPLCQRLRRWRCRTKEPIIYCLFRRITRHPCAGVSSEVTGSPRGAADAAAFTAEPKRSAVDVDSDGKRGRDTWASPSVARLLYGVQPVCSAIRSRPINSLSSRWGHWPPAHGTQLHLYFSSLSHAPVARAVGSPSIEVLWLASEASVVAALAAKPLQIGSKVSSTESGTGRGAKHACPFFGCLAPSTSGVLSDSLSSPPTFARPWWDYSLGLKGTQPRLLHTAPTVHHRLLRSQSTTQHRG